MDLHYLGLVELSRLIAARRVSPVEVTEALLQRIEELDGRLKSYVRVTAEITMAQARVAEQEIVSGHYRGPLHGVPIALKDLFDTKGIPSAAGMPLRRDYVAAKDATVVQRLHDAGAVILGTLKMTEGAHADHRPPLFETPLNPWGEGLWPGASSSGSGVATAAGLCYAALGTDTGGSIRLPAAVDGVTGLMPTWGRVSRAGVFAFAALLDHVGPFARSAADTGAILGVIAGPDQADLTASFEPVPDYLARLGESVRGLRVGIDRDMAFGRSDPAVTSAIEAALAVYAGLGAEIVAIRFPDTAPIVKGYLPLAGVQAAVAHEATYPKHREHYGPAMSAVIELGHSLSAMDYHRLLLQQAEFRGRVDALFETVDLVALPVLPFPAPTLARMADTSDEGIEGIVRFTSPIDVSGHPAIAIPCGLADRSRPISLQLVAPRFAEAELIRVADAFQRQTDWHQRHPVA